MDITSMRKNREHMIESRQNILKFFENLPDEQVEELNYRLSEILFSSGIYSVDQIDRMIDASVDPNFSTRANLANFMSGFCCSVYGWGKVSYVHFTLDRNSEVIFFSGWPFAEYANRR